MKTNKLILILVVLIAFLYASCENEDEDIQKPVISNLEVGHNDTIHLGEEIHIEFEVTDDNRMDYYRIVIHSEEEHDHKSLNEGEYWEIDTIFNEISGLRNYTVHHDVILVPENAETGNYHFYLSVVDQAGNVAEVERELYASDEEGHYHDDHEH
jgi:hypothetical protein